MWKSVAIMKERLTNAKYSCKILIYCGGKVKRPREKEKEICFTNKSEG